MSKWIPHVKGSPGESYEISVVREDNTHGFKSYGWHDQSKKLHISDSSGASAIRISERIWTKLVVVAAEVAAELNEEEGNE